MTKDGADRVVIAAPDRLRDYLAQRCSGLNVRTLDGATKDVTFLVPAFGASPDFAQMPVLRVVQTLSAGTEWIEDLIPPGVTLCSARGTRDASVAQWIVGAILSALSGLLPAAQQRRWDHRPPLEASATTILIVGYGSIGQATAERLEPLGARVIGVGRRRLGAVHATADLPTLLPQADCVVNLLPLNHQTDRLFDASLFAAMPDGALFVNAGRGGTVAQGDLLDELQTGRLCAVLDVTDPEPLPADHPLWTAKGTLAITAHQAGDSLQADQRTFELVVEQLRRFADGQPLLNAVR